MRQNGLTSHCGSRLPCSRRRFMTTVGGVAGAALLDPLRLRAAGETSTRQREGARVRAAFLFPPSSTFSDNPEGWWSWPGNEFDAEARQRLYSARLATMATRLGMTVDVQEQPIGSATDTQRLIRQVETERPDGLLLVMFYNNSLGQADLVLKAAEAAGVPVVFYIGLGVKHGGIAHYRRPGVYFIQSLENFGAIEYGLRMINTRKLMRQSRLLSITEAKEPREGVERFFGITVRVLPFSQYSQAFEAVQIDRATRRLIRDLKKGAMKVRGVTDEAFENAARAHLALKGLLSSEDADGVTMNCLRRGMLKPCVSFSLLNSQLIPAACENDLPAVYTQLLGQLLLGRPGFQHNPCFETERNHYYASHCTCAARLYGPEGPALPYLLRRFAHTNEGSCAIQVFWNPGDPVTMVRYHPGKEPGLDIYAGNVVESHPMPPAGGCTTNVEIELTDREDACTVRGHHNLLFCGDYARKLRLFAELYGMQILGPA